MRKIGIKIWNFLFDFSPYLAAVFVLLISFIGLFDWHKITIEAFDTEKFPIGRIISYVTFLLTLTLSLFGIEWNRSVVRIEDSLKKKSIQVSALEETLTQVKEENVELFNSYLKSVFKNLSLTYNERITVYKAEKDGFYLIGRSSENPELKKPGRNSYPRSEGFISLGWERGYFFIDDLPDPEDFDNYSDEINRIKKMPDATLKKLNMKSRNFLVYRMNGYDGEASAVVVIESLNTNALDEEKIRIMVEEEENSLVMFIEKNSQVQIRNSNLAEESGL